jgi:ribosomal protein S12 methylthiotransferase
VALRTTFIAGFPGETDSDVDRLCDFIEEQAFDHVGVFTYSHEEGTSAFDLDNDVPAADKSARQRRVMALQKRLIRNRQHSRIGERTRIMVDGPASDHELVLKGRLSTQAPDIDASVFLTDCDPSTLRAGDLVQAEIVGAKDYDFVARPIPA